MPSCSHSTARPFSGATETPASSQRAHKSAGFVDEFSPLRGVFTAPPLVARPIWRALKVRPRLQANPEQLQGIPTWTKSRYLDAVKAAYGRFYLLRCRPAMSAGVSKDSVVRVASAMASHADFRTGRNCRPSLRRLMEMTHCSRRVVQRARRVLEILGLARLVVQGRRRTLIESISSWCCGDSSRGWASEYALTIPVEIMRLTCGDVDGDTPPRRGHDRRKGKTLSHTHRRVKKPRFPEGMALAHEWAGADSCPTWVRREPWKVARALQEAAVRGWSVADLRRALQIKESASGLAAKPDNPGGYLRWLVRSFECPPEQQRRAQQQLERELVRKESARIAAEADRRHEKKAPRSVAVASLEKLRRRRRLPLR